MNYKNVIIIFYLLLTNLTNAQTTLISGDSALKIAITNGLKTDLKEFDVSLVDTVWEIKSLLCSDNIEPKFDGMRVNAVSGEISHVLYDYSYVGGGGPIAHEKTHINTNYKLDSLPICNKYIIRKLTPEGLSNPIFSFDDKFIAFSFTYNKIAMESIDGSGFKLICDSCHSPQWISNQYIVYQKGKKLYKKNVITNMETCLINNPMQIFEYKISPDCKWIAYLTHMDHPDWRNIVQPTEGPAQLTLCLLSIDGKIKKFINNVGHNGVWDHYNDFFWTPNSDTILCYILNTNYISNTKYYATGLNYDTVCNYKYNLFQDLNLFDYENIINGVFPYELNCQILEVDKDRMLPKKILVSEVGRYRYLRLSHNLKYLIFSKTKSSGHDIFWIKELE